MDRVGEEPFSYPVPADPDAHTRAEREDLYRGASNKDFAYALKNRSDVMCDKFKLDLALSQTGTNFSADFINVVLGALGGGVGGTVAQATSATIGAVTGFKNTVTSDIYQKVTNIVSNYIDTSRDEEWGIVQEKLRRGAYSSKSEVRNDLQKYHARCSLIEALATAQRESANKKVDADSEVATPAALKTSKKPKTSKKSSNS